MNPATFRSIVWPFALAETLIWAATYYSFPALILTWEIELGWSKTQLSGAFTASLIVSAALAPFVGRQIDQGHGKALFTGGTVLAAASLATLSLVQTVWQFYALWLLLGVAMAAILYEACFAVLTKVMGSERKRAITLVTLMAGFAGTLSFPGNRLLVSWWGWRGSVIALAVLILAVVLPLFWIATLAAERHGMPHQPPPRLDHSLTSGLMRSPTFWLTGLGFALMAFNHQSLLTHLLPLLNERGVADETAVWAASFIGPMQVGGRLLMVLGERRFSSLALFFACCGGMMAASVALFSIETLPSLLFVFVALQGASHGVMSILRPVITADQLGMRNFGLISGLMALLSRAAAAAAPTLAALIWGVGGYDSVILMAIGAAALALIAIQRGSQRAVSPSY